MIKKQKIWVWASILIVCFVGLMGGVGWFCFPLEMRELSLRYELWKGNVTSVHLEGGWHGYLLDQCQAYPKSGCSCVVLIHGLADNALTWKKILLAPGSDWAKMGMDHPMKILAVDLPGSGDTPPPSSSEGFRVRKQAEKLRQLLSPICNQWVVVGNSLGGWIAAWLGLDWPEGVRRLLLLDSAGLSKGMEQDKSLLGTPTLETMKEFQKRAYFRPRVIPDWQWKAIVEHVKGSHADQIRAAQTGEDSLDTKLATLRRPTMLIWGKEDQIIPLSDGQQMRALIPGVLWREIPECGHLPQKECPLPVMQGIIDMIHFGAM